MQVDLCFKISLAAWWRKAARRAGGCCPPLCTHKRRGSLGHQEARVETEGEHLQLRYTEEVGKATEGMDASRASYRWMDSDAQEGEAQGGPDWQSRMWVSWAQQYLYQPMQSTKLSSVQLTGSVPFSLVT